MKTFTNTNGLSSSIYEHDSSQAVLSMVVEQEEDVRVQETSKSQKDFDYNSENSSKQALCNESNNRYSATTIDVWESFVMNNHSTISSTISMTKVEGTADDYDMVQSTTRQPSYMNEIAGKAKTGSTGSIKEIFRQKQGTPNSDDSSLPNKLQSISVREASLQWPIESEVANGLKVDDEVQSTSTATTSVDDLSSKRSNENRIQFATPISEDTSTCSKESQIMMGSYISSEGHSEYFEGAGAKLTVDEETSCGDVTYNEAQDKRNEIQSTTTRKEIVDSVSQERTTDGACEESKVDSTVYITESICSNQFQIINSSDSSCKPSNEVKPTPDIEATCSGNNQDMTKSSNIKIMKIVDLPWYEERIVAERCEEVVPESTPIIEAPCNDNKCSSSQSAPDSALKVVDLPWYQESIIPSSDLASKLEDIENEEAIIKDENSSDEAEPTSNPEAVSKIITEVGLSSSDEMSTCSVEFHNQRCVEAVFDRDETEPTAALLKKMTEASPSEDASACFSEYQTATVIDALPDQESEYLLEDDDIEPAIGAEEIFRRRTENKLLEDKSIFSSEPQPLSVVEISSQQDVEALFCECETQRSHDTKPNLKNTVEISSSNGTSTCDISSHRDIEAVYTKEEKAHKESYAQSKKRRRRGCSILIMGGLLLCAIVIVHFLTLYLTRNSDNEEDQNASPGSLYVPQEFPSPSQSPVLDYYYDNNFPASRPTIYPKQQSSSSTTNFPTSRPTLHPMAVPSLMPIQNSAVTQTATNAPSKNPTTAKVPGNTSHSCSICGHHEEVGNVNAIFEFIGQPPISCGELEESGKRGEIPDSHCGFLSTLVSLCECKSVTSGEVVFTKPSKASSPAPTPRPQVAAIWGSSLTFSPTTSMPTFEPSTTPSTLYPTFEPSTTPSMESSEPTQSASPTSSPTFKPSNTPSMESSEPTQSASPTSSPTFEPSSTPSMESSQPTQSTLPTYSPTFEPTSSPTFAPSSSPSSERDAYEQMSDFLQFLKDSPEEEFFIVNLVKYREQAVYEGGDSNGLTGKEANDIYESFMVKHVYPAVGAGMIFNATIADQRWDNANIVRYPNGTVYLNRILTSFEVQDKMKHNRAAVKDCLIFAAKRISVPEELREPMMANPPFPSSAVDPSFVYMDLLSFRTTANYGETSTVTNQLKTGREAMDSFDELSSARKARYGIRAPAWLNVSLTVKGNIALDQIRLETVPSMSSYAAMMQLPDSRQTWEHREAALRRDSIRMATTPTTVKNVYI